MNIEQAKRVPLTVLLDNLGYKPTQVKNNDYWYLSPLRTERTASFHVHATKNVWYDFGEEKGGNILHFAKCFLEKSGVSSSDSDALRFIKNMSGYASFIKPVVNEDHSEYDKKLVLKEVRPLERDILTRYLESRGVMMDIVHNHLKELRVFNANTGRTFFTIGMKNQDGGYELRNPKFKGCLGRKSISFIRGIKPKPERLHIFEGFMDYYSLIAQNERKPLIDDAIILHSVSCLRKVTPYIYGYGYKTIYTWMDNDKSGKKATENIAEYLKTEEGVKQQPMNKVYKSFKDVNAWHMHKSGLVIN